MNERMSEELLAGDLRSARWAGQETNPQHRVHPCAGFAIGAIKSPC